MAKVQEMGFIAACIVVGNEAEWSGWNFVVGYNACGVRSM